MWWWTWWACAPKDCPDGFEQSDRLCIEASDSTADTESPSDTAESDTELPSSGESSDTGGGPVTGFGCTNDDTTGLPQGGSFSIQSGRAFVPLCSGEVLVPVAAAGEVRHLVVGSDTPLATWNAGGVVTSMALDPQLGLLWLARDPATQLTRLDLTAGTSSDHPAGTAPKALRVTDDGLLLALTEGTPFNPVLRVLDAAGSTVNETTISGLYDPSLMVYDEADDFVLFGDRGLSPSGLYRYRFNPATGGADLDEYLRDAGSNGQDLAISPDGEHLAFPCGGGNGVGYTIYDYDPDGFSTVLGEWDTDAYPRAAAFSPDGRRMLGSNGNTVFLFDVATHVVEDSWEPPGCTYGVYGVAFSRGGDVAYTWAPCDLGNDSEGVLGWRVLR